MHHKRMASKPIPPTKFDGSVDSKTFYRFIAEGTVYVEDKHKCVPLKKRAFASHLVRGRSNSAMQVTEQSLL